MFITVGFHPREHFYCPPIFAPKFRLLPSVFKVTAFRPHLKKTPTCYIYQFTGMKMRPSTHTIPPEATPRKERAEDLASVYLFISLPPFVLDLPDRSGCHAPLISYNSLFLLTSSVNIPWSSGGKGDGDYIYAFEEVVMPIAREFGPEIVLGRCPLSHMTCFLTRFLKFRPDSMPLRVIL